MYDSNTVLLNTKAQPVPTRLLHHYSPISKLGFPVGVRCWCNARLEFTVHERGMQAKRKAFFDQHDECDAPKEGK